ncbi:MAG: tetratricopeptide repeat protein, partial [Gemmatimonadota bacterium]|nr:tetratricopeptide repeat protein [Gemmatimonadota bacterium]
LLLLGRAAEAVTGAQAAATAEAGNPQHQFLLGQAQIAAGNFAEAHAAFTRAQELCPEFAAEITPERERGWATAFQAGLTALQANDTATAVARWEAANTLFPARPDAHYNLGVVYAGRGDLARASQAYRQALQIASQPTTDTAEVAGRAETRQNAMAGLLSIGAQQFSANQFQPAAETFRHLTTVDPNNRDAWYNYGLALYKMERWDELVPVAQRLVQIDPLNENARVILFNAYKSPSEAARAARNTARQRELEGQALRVYEELTNLPVYVDQVRFQTPEGGTGALTGQVMGNRANAGTPVNLTFTFYGPTGTMGTQSVTVQAPAKGQAAPFRVPLPAGTVTSFSYTYR